ncbi:MAG: phytoene/squalene synthase family protein [Flavobacteriales bacterium]|nr:phytoene/squalene synthase family protein [Flavobacteriales bacterium]
MKHDQREIFDRVAYKSSRITTHAYSTSFSFGIRMLDKRMRDPICAIYGMVRFADEIVDTFHEHDKQSLMQRFREDTFRALDEGISLNPILHSFQKTCKEYNIERSLVDTFLRSMEMDLNRINYDRQGYDEYILGSAEVVGLMCLRVFTEGNNDLYESLKPNAMSLGAAFQKINFLRDLRADYMDLGRTYFPQLDFRNFTKQDKEEIEREIERDFNHAYEGILKLPRHARLGVLIAYVYYKQLFLKIRSVPSDRIMEERIRIPNQQKLALMMSCYIRNNLNML